MSERENCLDTAKKMICGEREHDYGTPEDNFATIAKLWNTYLNTNSCIEIKSDGGISGTITYGVSPKDVAMMMCLLKIARIATGSGTGDSFIDLAGYAACGYEIQINKLKKEVKPGYEERDKINERS